MTEMLTETCRRLLAETTARAHRYLFDAFDASGRLTGLVGPRGVGKTTLMLQYIRDRIQDPAQAFYVSADHIYFNKVSLLDFVREVFRAALSGVPPKAQASGISSVAFMAFI